HRRKAISFGRFSEMTVPLPPIEEQRRIAAILDQADELRRKRRDSLAATERLARLLFEQTFLLSERDFPLAHVGDLLASTQYGTSDKSGESGDLPILRMGNLTYDGEMSFCDLKYISLPERDRDKMTVKSGDILFNRTNSPDLVGKTAVFR